MNKRNLPWAEKHRPESLIQLVGNVDLIQDLMRWTKSWIQGIPKRRAALILGPPGIGKTAAVGVISNELDMELVEFNASDKRNKANIETQVWRAATQQTLDGRMRIILLDEVDGLSGSSDRGGIGAILKVIRETVHPIVMTANNPDSPRLKDLLKECRVFEFEIISYEDTLKVLERIGSGHGIDRSILEKIAENAGGDLRAAISDLEVASASGVSSELLVSSRDVRRGVKETLRRLFMTTETVSARNVVSTSDVDHDKLLLWLDENIHLHLGTAEELDTGMEALSLADLALGRIMRSQNWKLLSYAYDFLSAGVATSRQKTSYRRVTYSDPNWPLLVWRGNRNRDKKSGLLSKLSETVKVSNRRIVKTHYDTIEAIIERNPISARLFTDWLGIKAGAFNRKVNRHSRR
ncbi:MAG: replication factor C large subunit [Candidatus Thorarchaeota archaeon]|jgi:replication factor C large subunit